MNHPLLIDTETLQEQLGKPGLVVIDVRGRAAYEFGGHIPGAVHSTWHEYSDPKAVAKGLLNPDLGQIDQILRRLGVNHDSDVVIYWGSFSVGGLNLEFQDTRMNAQLLRELAAVTGGGFIDAARMDSLIPALRAIPTFTPHQSERGTSHGLWDWPVVLGTLLALLSTEWTPAQEEWHALTRIRHWIV